MAEETAPVTIELSRDEALVLFEPFRDDYGHLVEAARARLDPEDMTRRPRADGD